MKWIKQIYLYILSYYRFAVETGTIDRVVLIEYQFKNYVV